MEFTVISGGMLFAEAPPFGCVPVYGHVSGGTAEAFRLAIIGTGSRGRFLMSFLLQNPKVEIVALCGIYNFLWKKH